MSNTEQPGLARVLGTWTATAIVAGTIIGSGVFKKPAVVADLLPYSGLVAAVWVIMGLLVFLGALAYAEVAVVLPHAGGNYVFLRDGYSRLAGFLWGWVEFWMIRSGSIAALAAIFAESLSDILRQYDMALSPWGQRFVAVSLILASGWVNLRGVRLGGALQVFVTAVKVLSLSAIAVVPLLFLFAGTSPGGTVPTFDNLAPVWPDDWSKVTAGALAAAFLAVLWPYHGWMNIAPIAGEVRDPQRTLPRALLLGVVVVIALYLGCNASYYLTLGGPEIAAQTKTPVATVAFARLLGGVGATVASAMVMCSVFGSLNGNVMVGPRSLYAMGRDGLVPAVLGRIHPAYGTPAAAVVAVAAWSAGMILLEGVLSDRAVIPSLKSPFDQFTDFAMFGAVVFETMAVLAIFRLRRLMPDAPRPYRCPGYPVVPILYTIIPAFIVGNLFWKDSIAALWKESREALVGVAFIAVGAVVYFACGLWRVPAKSAES